MFNITKLKSDYASLFNNINTNQQTLPNGYPCSFDSDCTSPAVCQFNVCTINIGGNEINDLSNICRGISIKECAKEMQKERERTEVPIYVPNFPTPSVNTNTGNNGTIGNIPSINTPSVCKYDRDCNKSEVCISGVCVEKSNFPLIARQRKLKSSFPLQSNEIKQNIYTINQIGNIQKQNLTDLDIKKYFQHKNTPLDGKLSPYEYMFLLEQNETQNKSILSGLHDDYFYLNN